MSKYQSHIVKNGAGRYVINTNGQSVCILVEKCQKYEHLENIWELICILKLIFKLVYEILWSAKSASAYFKLVYDLTSTEL